MVEGIRLFYATASSSKGTDREKWFQVFVGFREDAFSIKWPLKRSSVEERQRKTTETDSEMEDDV